MELYRLALNYLECVPGIQAWPEARALLARVGTHRPRYWQLPVIAGESIGEEARLLIPGMAAIAALYTSIVLIDDMLDDDPKGEYRRLGQAATANLAAALQAAGFVAIAESEHPLAVKSSILHCLHQMVISTALGQHWDVQNPQDEEAYWQVVRTKSAPFFGAAFYTGALLGGADEVTAEKMHQFGALYGEIVQLHDDLGDVMETPANPDWRLGRSPLPVLFARMVPHPEQTRFQALCRVIHDPEALAEAQTILIRCGAVSYVIDQLLYRYVQTRKILASLTLARPQRMYFLLDEVVNPVKELLAGVGFRQAELLLDSLLPPFEPTG